MKKFYILLFALFLLNRATGQGTIPALSVDASAKSNHPAFDLQHRSLYSMENVQGMMGNKEWKTSAIHSEINLGRATNLQMFKQPSLIQLFDSVYQWQWDSLNTGWKIESKVINIVYDVKNNMTSYIEKNWNGTAWVNFSQYIYTYDANNNQTSNLSQTWNGNDWENDFQYFCTYDANNNKTDELYQHWNGSAWEDVIQYLYTYDANNFTKGFSYKSWNLNGTKITFGDSAYYYFHTNVGINDLILKQGSITVYPNPSSGKITISTPNKGNLSILNLSGQELITHPITEPKTQLDITSLPSGVYFVRVTNDRTVQVGKFIKR
jgi:Secretion system C-terminal sorting domain